jgi:hypothetical protein
MTIYKLTWFLPVEDRIIEKLITDKDTAEAKYNEVKKALHKGSWIGMQELNEDAEHTLHNGAVLHYNDI